MQSTTADAGLPRSLFLYFVLGLLLFGRGPFYASETGLATGDRGGMIGWVVVVVAERSCVKGKITGEKRTIRHVANTRPKKREGRKDKLNDEEDGYV